ncbi:MAG: hypothetical protein R2747_20160 [Pyrinomonadaceae bacterium]
MAQVNFNGKTVSDGELKEVLEAICRVFKSNVNVTSGDRSAPREDGAKDKSLHLQKRAVDFHVEGVDDGTAYEKIKLYFNHIFSNSHGYEFIWHGPYTETGGQHLHIGRYGSAYLGYVKCIKEGITPQGKKVYQKEITLNIVFGRQSYIKPPVYEGGNYMDQFINRK